MTTLQKWLVAIATILTTSLGILGSVSGVFEDIGNYFVEKEQRKIKEKAINNMLVAWEQNRKYLGMQFDLQTMYRQRGITIDSLAFDVQQLNNYVWSEMSPYHITDSCQNPCKYWFRKDVNGTIWYRDRETNHLYTIVWNNTVGKYEYTDWLDKKQFIPHRWENDN